MSFKSEFKEFINQGNVMDMAVGIIIGSAFTAIVTALVDNVIKPIITLVAPEGMDKLGVTLPNGAFVDFGTFIGAIIDFILIALVVFLMIRTLNKMRRKGEEPEAPAATCPFCKEEVKEGATRCPHCAGEFAAPAVPEA